MFPPSAVIVAVLITHGRRGLAVTGRCGLSIYVDHSGRGLMSPMRRGIM